MKMNRREILKYASMITGATICAPITAVLLSGCSKHTENVAADVVSGQPLQFFSQDDFNLMTQLMDVILPKTDSPSASEVQVNYIVDNMFAQAYPADYRQKFIGIFTDLKVFLNNKNFTKLAKQQQESVLLSLETLPEAKRNNAYWAYIDLKQQTVAFYLSTEEIAEHYLNYLPIPGEYKPCVPLAELGGKAWAI